ncbi:MAG: FAD-binding oxidoreductase [Chloroflexota bacterium]
MNAATLQNIVGKDWVITNREQMLDYLRDAILDSVMPRIADNVILVKPANTEEISKILKLANKEKFPVVVRGGGSGLSGGAIPTIDCVLLSVERLNRIEEVDKANLMITAQGGVTYDALTKAAEDAGMFFPPKPGSVGAFVGGVVACNAAGARAIKYGVTRNFVKGLEVVLPSGDIVELGGKLIKNAMGLDLLHLMVGSGGTLGVITKAIFRLLPKPPHTCTLVASFNERLDAMKVAPLLALQMIIPLAGEYLDHDLCETSAKFLGTEWPAKKGKAHIFYICEGETEDEVYSQAEKISKICEENGAIDVLMAETKAEQDNILKIRGEIASAQKAEGNVGDFLDICVPPSKLPELMERILEIEKKYNTKIPVTGHSIDGNLHPTPLKELADRGLLEQVKEDIYRETIRLNGVLTGEHGLGTIRLHNTSLWPDPKIWELMRGIKRAFDPNNILNPQRAFPD